MILIKEKAKKGSFENVGFQKVFFMQNWHAQKHENWLFKKYQMSV